MEKKSSGGQQGSGSGGQKGTVASKPAAAAPKPGVAATTKPGVAATTKPGIPAVSKPVPRLPGMEGRENPRQTLNAIAAVVMPAGGTQPKEPPNETKKHLEANVFSSGSQFAERKSKLPSVWTGSARPTHENLPALAFDGVTPAEEVTPRDVWRAIQPPVTSQEGSRSPKLYEQILNQFAVGHNARYEPEAPDKPRSHIFVWDVSRAMHAEIPHMVGARELSLIQTLDWLRYEGSTRGWIKVMPETAVEGANEGKPVVVTPKAGVTKVALLGMVRPGGLGPNGHPRVAAAAKARGNDLSPQDAFGVFAFEYFMHA